MCPRLPQPNHASLWIESDDVELPFNIVVAMIVSIIVLLVIILVATFAQSTAQNALHDLFCIPRYIQNLLGNVNNTVEC